MKLYYWNHEEKNFGDQLNPWLWQRLLPDFLDNDENTIFLGIGTLLNNRVPALPKKIIFGTGVGYGDKPILDDKWEFYGVRGPRSASTLGLPSSMALTDPAILLKLFTWPSPTKNGPAFIPHYTSLNHYDWPDLCEKIGIRLIDPCWPVEKVIFEILSSTHLLCEAMHGAIVADTLRIPWTPIICYSHINDFKWHDWCESLALHYRPIIIPGVFENTDIITRIESFAKYKYNLKRIISMKNMRKFNLTPPPAVKSSQDQVTKFIRTFQDNMTSSKSCLSSDLGHTEALTRTTDALKALMLDFDLKNMVTNPVINLTGASRLF